MSTTNRVYAGQATPERVGDRRAQLVSAGVQLMGDEGAAAVTMRAVTRLARLSPRYFYESFPTRTDLLIAVLEHVADQAAQVVTESLAAAPADPRQQTHAAFVAFAELCEREPRVPRILFRETTADPMLWQRARDRAPKFVQSVGATLADERWSTVADSAQVHLDVSALTGAVSNLFLDWSEGRVDVTPDELAEYCTELVVGMVQRRRGWEPRRRPATRAP